MITDEKTAAKFAGEALVAKAALQQREKALKAWADAHGSVPLNSDAGRERVWGFVSRKRVSRPTREELEKALYLHGSHVNLNDLYKEATITKFEQHTPLPKVDEPDPDEVVLAALDQSLSDQEKAA